MGKRRRKPVGKAEDSKPGPSEAAPKSTGEVGQETRVADMRVGELVQLISASFPSGIPHQRFTPTLELPAEQRVVDLKLREFLGLLNLSA